ncbi:hypothetical protein Barb7_03259 [Bacteroidales bacterium Barb7]|nr:hypothetical protein Barb7_03259 [Bacteroidales bacterium Barb7]
MGSRTRLLMSFPPTCTYKASGRSLAPLQEGQTVFPR